MRTMSVCVIVVLLMINAHYGLSAESPKLPLTSKGSMVTPVIDFEGQPPYLIIGESYTLECSTSSPTKDFVYIWAGGETDYFSFYGRYTLPKLPSVNTNISCITLKKGGNDTATSDPVEIIVKDDVKYCSDVPTNCRGLNKTACSRLYYVCECGPGHKIEGKQCVEYIAPPVIEVEGQPPYLIIGENYTLDCSTSLPTEDLIYIWAGGETDYFSFHGKYPITEITSVKRKIICAIFAGNKSATSEPLKIVVKDDVKYCHDVPKSCTGQLSNNAACSELYVCECGPSIKIKGNRCDVSGARSLHMGTSFLILLICLVIEFL